MQPVSDSLKILHIIVSEPFTITVQPVSVTNLSRIGLPLRLSLTIGNAKSMRQKLGFRIVTDTRMARVLPRPLQLRANF